MPYRKIQFINDHYYHLLNRGIEGRCIFMDEQDHWRFLEGLKEFNDAGSVSLQRIHKENRFPISISDRNRESIFLVHILCYCLMPNHFHILVKQTHEGGVQKFMRKLGVGYTNYFNLKHERQGHLFQGSFKAVLMENDSQFLHLSRYIHLNPLDLHAPEWREGKIEDWEKARKYLENYPWSSYPIFVGKKLSSFCYPELLGKMFQSPQQYEDFVKGWTGRNAKVSDDYILE